MTEKKDIVEQAIQWAKTYPPEYRVWIRRGLLQLDIDEKVGQAPVCYDKTRHHPSVVNGRCVFFVECRGSCEVVS
jgi:hypothetical protein